MTQVDRAFLDVSAVERRLTNADMPEALQYWHSQDRSLRDEDIATDGRMPSGWWLLPSLILGVGAWALIIMAIF